MFRSNYDRKINKFNNNYFLKDKRNLEGDLMEDNKIIKKNKSLNVLDYETKALDYDIFNHGK